MIRFTDTYVQIVARGLMMSDERLVGAFSGFRAPWFLPGPLKRFFIHNYLILTTNHRLILVDHRKGLIFDRLDVVESYAWQDVSEFRLTGLLFKDRLKFRVGQRPFKLRLHALNAPIANNFRVASQVVGQITQMRSTPPPSLAPAPMPQQLGVSPFQMSNMGR